MRPTRELVSVFFLEEKKELTLRQEAWERRKRLELRNLSLEPCGLTNPARESLASNRKRVLRGGRRLPLRSVDSKCLGRAIEPRKIIAGAVVLVSHGGRASTPLWQACLVPPGSENRAKAHEGSPGTWEPRPSPSQEPEETGITNSRSNLSLTSWAVGINRGRNDGIAKRRQRSAARRADGSRSAS